MSRGFSLAELAIVLLVVGLLAGIGLPRLRPALDQVMTDRAVVEVTTALSITRNAAVMQATLARLTLAADTLRIDRLGPDGWIPFWRRPGPADLGVALEVSNDVVVFGPTGLGWSASNTTIVLRRGSQVETITTSRLGRVKRW
jgi:prepilin-type N-terminal cleavage/methylation domain-containing protein